MNAAGVVRQHVEDAIAAEKAFEKQLREISRDRNDDDDVQAFFAAHADQTKTQHERLATRLGGYPELDGDDASNLAALLNLGPHIEQPGAIAEERTLQNLLTVYTIETGECAMYEALARVARAAGDIETEQLARQLQNEERLAADGIWHFLPSRSKIAFNMLTISEIDPAVETKMADDRIIGD